MARYAPAPPGAAPGSEPLTALVAAAKAREADRATWGETLATAAKVLAKKTRQGRPTKSQRFRFINPTTRVE